MSLLLLFNGGIIGPINGNLAAAEGNDGISTSAVVGLQSSLATAEGDDFPTAAGAVLITASAFVSEGDDAGVASAILEIRAAGAITEIDDVPSAAGAVDIIASGIVTEADDAFAANASLGIVANAIVAEDDDTIAITALMPIWYPRRGGIEERQELERRQREWQEGLRRIIDEAWLVANGIIDPVTRQVIPPPDYSPVIEAMIKEALTIDQARAEAFMAEETRRQEEDAIAILLLAA